MAGAGSSKVPEGVSPIKSLTVGSGPNPAGSFRANKGLEAVGLKEELSSGLAAARMSNVKSDAQEQVISAVINQKSAIATAPEGMGVTTALAIGALQVVDPSVKSTQAIFLTATDEGATKIATSFGSICEGMGISCHLLPGEFIGRSTPGVVDPGVKSLQESAILVGTPSRVYAMMEGDMQSIRTDGIKLIVVDDVHDMFSPFADPWLHHRLREILSMPLPSSCRFVIAGREIPGDAETVISKVVEDPVRITG
jgi:superfamily II DNA/RNA helicase